MTESKPLSNACTRAADLVNDAFHKGDWDEWRRWFADDVTLDDRRLGLGHAATGPDEALDYVKALSDVGIERVVWTPIATRGKRLATFRTTAMNADGFEVERLAVSAVDKEGKFVSHVFFDCDERDDASAELDRLFVSGEGANGAEVIDFMNQLLASVNARPVAIDESRIDEDVVLVDRRPASMGEVRGREGVTAFWRTLRDVAPKIRSDIVTFHALAEDRYVVEQLNHGVTEDDAWVEMSFHILMQLRNGRLVRSEMFALDQLEAALRRFEELG